MMYKILLWNDFINHYKDLIIAVIKDRGMPVVLLVVGVIVFWIYGQHSQQVQVEFTRI